ncbi:hypothetical protein AB0I51_42285 [Streptomyces sp. NPDC050549]|uniref:hypothetical protein n=1 Tax=Streptomyces sp. NPDC050549 TaxID=3155406 RepID=UPI00343D30BE
MRQDVEDLGLDGHVEGGGRLVGDEDVRFAWWWAGSSRGHPGRGPGGRHNQLLPHHEPGFPGTGDAFTLPTALVRARLLRLTEAG